MQKKKSKKPREMKYAVLLGKSRRCLTLFDGKDSITLKMNLAAARRLGKLLISR